MCARSASFLSWLVAVGQLNAQFPAGLHNDARSGRKEDNYYLSLRSRPLRRKLGGSVSFGVWRVCAVSCLAFPATVSERRKGHMLLRGSLQSSRCRFTIEVKPKAHPVVITCPADVHGALLWAARSKL